MSIENKQASGRTPAECYVHSIGDMKIMKGNVTPEVTSAHRNLEKLCKKFEASVDEFCALPLQSIRTEDFYESECVPIAVECVDALSKFESARSYEITAYERTVDEADDTLRQEKRKLEVNTVQRAKAYEDTVTQADETLRQQLHRFEEGASQRIEETYKNAVVGANNTLNRQIKKIEGNANRGIEDIESDLEKVGEHFTFSQEKTTIGYVSKIPYDLALKRANRVLEREKARERRSKSFPSDWQLALEDWGVILFCLLLVAWLIGGFFVGFMEAFLLFIGIPIGIRVIVAIMFSFLKSNRKLRALRALRSAAIAECDMIQEDMEVAIASAVAERDKKLKDAQTRQREAIQAVATAAEVNLPTARRERDAKVKDAHERKEREDKQAVEAEMNALAARDEKVKEIRSRTDLAIAYIVQEYQVFDSRLCQCLDKFQALIGTWTVENAHVTSILNENRSQNISGSSERIGYCLTRVGTVGIWDMSGITRDDVKTVKSDFNREAAERGEPWAQKKLGDMYRNGNGVPQDYAEALKWYRKAAEQGDADAQYNLGVMYEKGIGVHEDYEEAIKWYRKAAEQGDTYAHQQLNLIYESSMGVHGDYEEAIKWYRKAAEWGCPGAQFNLGVRYTTGKGVRQDVGEAIEWYRKAMEAYRKAAEQGDTSAQLRLGLMYEFGLGVQQDYSEALKWYEKASK